MKSLTDRVKELGLSQDIKNELTKLGYIHLPCIHKKTGDRYWIESIVINCTNSLDGQLMVNYFKADLPNSKSQRYVREIYEFFEKFTLIK